MAESVSALGICRAHGGSLLGLLLDPVKVDVDEINRYARSRFPEKIKISITSLVAGGPRFGMPTKDFSTSQKSQNIVNGAFCT